MADLRTLDRRLYPYAKWLYDVAKFNDARFQVTSAYRSWAAQKRLYDKWLAGESTIMAAAPGRSAHQRRVAFDLARVGIDPLSDDLLPLLGSLWTSLGGLYGGPRDPVHFGVRV